MLWLAFLVGCDPVVEGPHGLAYDGSPDCAMVGVGEPPAAFTVETWLRSDPAAFDDFRPLVIWSQVFELSQRDDGQVVFFVGTEDVGASYGFSLMDGVLHHVAGTYDATDGSVLLFVDGKKVGASTTPAFVGDNPDDRVQYGCAKEETEAFYGILDELRVSSTVRYTDDFELPTSIFKADDDTEMLFHLDEGTGDTAADSAGDHTMDLAGTSWVEFDAGSEG